MILVKNLVKEGVNMQKWNKNYLTNLYSHFWRLAANENDPTESLEYESTANSIRGIIERYNELSHKKVFSIQRGRTPNFREVISSDLDVVAKYGYYCPYIRDLDQLNEKYIVTPKDFLPKIGIDTERIMTISSDFYQQFKGCFADAYQGMARTFKNTLFFHKLTRGAIENGQTHPVYRTKIAFFELGVDGTFQDYNSVIHEMGHGVSYRLNNEAMWDLEKYCLIEVDSLFFELLGIDYIESQLNLPKDGFEVRMQVLNDYLYAAKLITTKLDMYSMLNQKELSSMKEIKVFFDEETNFNALGQKDVLKTYISDYIHYVISYLTAIELYLIYQSAPEVALELLRKIIMRVETSNINYLNYIHSLGIVPGENFEKYLGILMSKAKELKDEKSLRYKN